MKKLIRDEKRMINFWGEERNHHSSAVGSLVKNLAYTQETWGSIPDPGRSHVTEKLSLATREVAA